MRTEGDAAVGINGVVKPSLWHALPYYTPILVLLLVVNAAAQGGWWMAAPMLFFLFGDAFDKAFGAEERNMDPANTSDGQLFWHSMALWMCVALWPATLLFTLWQVLVAGQWVAWEALIMAVLLGNVASIILVAGHDVVHMRPAWKRWIGEFLLGTIGCAHYAAEHVYVHHAHVATPRDPMTPRKGQSFWRYLPRAVAGSIVESWRNARNRLSLRRLPAWHYRNPFWRYALFNFGWFAVAYSMGGAWGILIFSIQCAFAIFLLRLGDYVEHYGLTRLRLPNGRFERFQPQHSWNTAQRFSNWLYYNTQRHSDHHGKAMRGYPLLQNLDESQAPRMPGSYAKAFNLALSPKRWFETMDPLVENWRKRHYPQVTDWSVYDSPAFASRPDAFETIAEIHASAPRLAAWIDRSPELLDCPRRKEFTDLELPRDFASEPEFEAAARRGLARVYWLHEFGVSEMRERIEDIPVQSVREAVEAVRHWSNDKVFQIGIHTIRGSLSPIEAGTALSNVAEASITAVLSAVEEDFARAPEGGGVAAISLGDLASGEIAPATPLDLLFVHDGEGSETHQKLCRRFADALRTMSRDSLLFAHSPRCGTASSLADFVAHHRSAASPGERLGLTRARCIFVHGNSDIPARFYAARREILADPGLRETLAAIAREPVDGSGGNTLLSIEAAPGGLRDVERAARLLQLRQDTDAGENPAPSAASIFRSAGDAGKQLEEAAVLWRSVNGVERLVAPDGCTMDALPGSVKSAIARLVGVDDFDALVVLVRETASRAAAQIDALDV